MMKVWNCIAVRICLKNLPEAQLLLWICPCRVTPTSFSLEKFQNPWPGMSWPHPATLLLNSWCLACIYLTCKWVCSHPETSSSASVEVRDMLPSPTAASWSFLPLGNPTLPLLKSQFYVELQPSGLPRSRRLLTQMGFSQLMFLICFSHLITCLCAHTHLVIHLCVWTHPCLKR